MRIAHISDLHVARSPRYAEYNPKRLLGYINHRLFRSRLYQERIAESALAALMRHPPDLVLLTGDITQHGLDSEFDAAEKLLAPVFQGGVPILAVSGNHDIYGHTDRTRLDRFLQTILLGLRPDRRGVYRFDGVELLPLSQSVPTPIFFSYGRQNSGELRRAREVWSAADDGVMRLACGHYPAIDSRGWKWLYFRGLREAAKLIDFCAGHYVSGYFCGHNHKRFATPMPGGCVQYAAPALSSVRHAGNEWVSVYECGPHLAHPVDQTPAAHPSA
jgi:3',5'-cyclic AMP phosphodiesterase CpdA